ncbi:hypothetical protein AOLI_G00149340 [Acnodon oligacanthus]
MWSIFGVCLFVLEEGPVNRGEEENFVITLEFPASGQSVLRTSWKSSITVKHIATLDRAGYFFLLAQ